MKSNETVRMERFTIVPSRRKKNVEHALQSLECNLLNGERKYELTNLNSPSLWGRAIEIEFEYGRFA